MSHDATSEQAPDPSTAPETGAAPQGDDSPLDALRRERDALQDRLLRTAAEFDNYRKRVDRERKDLREFLIAEALSDLLPVIDDLERALQATGSDAEALRKGVELIHQQMLDLLRKRGAKAIEAVGTDFDPRIHESVMLESSEAHREGEVIAEFRRGYMLGERLLRPSMVKVAKA